MALVNTGINFRATGISPTVAGVNRIRQATAQLGNTIQKTGRQSRASTTGVGRFFDALSAPSRAVSSIGAGIQSAGRQIEGFGRTTARVGATFSLGFSVPVVVGIQSALSAFSEFEDELVKINTLVGLSTEQVSQLVNGLTEVTTTGAGSGLAEEAFGQVERQLPGLIDLVGETGVELTELTRAAFAATSGQLSVADSLELVSIAAKASQIGLGDTDKITRAAAGAMQAFGISAEEAVDTLVLAVRFGNIEVDTFASQIGKLGGIANVAGITFQDSTAFIAAFTLAGASASEATTALRSTLTAIVRPTDASREALAKIGFTAEQVQQSLGEVGLTATLIKLRDEFDKAGVPFTEFIRNVRALSGAAFLTSEEFEEAFQNIAVNIDAFAQEGGVTLSAFETVTQTTSFQIDLLKANANLLGVSLGAVLAPAFNKLLTAITPVVAAFTEFVRQNPKIVNFVTIIAGLVAILGPLVAVGGILVTIFGGIISAVGSLIGLFGALISPLGAVIGLLTVFAAGLGTSIVAGLIEIGERADKTFQDIADAALVWGQNIVVNLAQGIINGITEVVRALRVIGEVFRSWLAPGSPPMLLPQLPDWGENIMNELLGGLFNADLAGTFRDLSGLVEQAFRNNLEIDADVINQILNFREGLAGAILTVQDLGIAAPFEEIVANLGLADGALRDYIDTMLRLAAVSEEVKRVQEDIVEINRQFDEAVAPLNEELDAISDRRKEVQEQLRIEELQRILADRRLTPLAKELALMELRELELKRQLEREEEIRDAAVEEEQAKLDALQTEQQALEEQARLQKVLIEIQQDQLDLFKELDEILNKVKDKLDDIGGSGGVDALIGDGIGIGADPLGGLNLPDPEDFDLESILGEGLFEGAQDIVDSFNSILEQLQGPIGRLRDEFEKLKDVWGDIVQAFIDAEGIPDFTLPIEDTIAWRIAVNELETAAEAVTGPGGPIEQLQRSAERFSESFGERLASVPQELAFFSGSSLGILGVLLTRVVAAVSPVIASIIQLVELAATQIIDTFVTNFLTIPGLILSGDFSGAVSESIALFVRSIGRVGALIASAVGLVFNLITSLFILFTGTTSNIARDVDEFVDKLIESTNVTGEEIKASIIEFFSGIGLEFDNFGLNIGQKVTDFLQGLVDSYFEWRNQSQTEIDTFFQNAIPAFDINLTEIAGTVQTWIDDVQLKLETFATDGFNAINQFLVDSLGGFFQFGIDIAAEIDTALNKVKTFIENFSLYDAMKSVGQSVVQGFIDGFNSLIAEAQGLLSLLGSGGAEQVAEETESNSPSKVYARIGRDVALGFNLGLQSVQAGIKETISTMVMPPIQQAVAAPSTVTNASLTFGDTIINNDMDAAVFDARVRRVLENVLGDF